VIALTFQGLAIWCGENGLQFYRFQVASVAVRSTFNGDPENRRALRRR
jgi:hypothetical protein